ncbi:MAG: helix-turn-helix domain-containing protein [Candidatus Brocadiales bacterium]|nr:helix-turn-helix domain-containing protein [Candidatus Brocadiales bacterium]
MPIQLGELKLYLLKELSKSLGITTFTLRTYIRQGRLRARKMGTKWLVTEEALREYFKETQESKKEARISLQGITSNSKVTEKDLEETKAIWK